MTIDERLARIDAKMDENAEAFTRFWTRSERSADDLHAFTQQMSLRSERINLQQVELLRQLRQDMRASNREWREEMRAHRGALLAILDRLGGGPAPPATGDA